MKRSEIRLLFDITFRKTRQEFRPTGPFGRWPIKEWPGQGPAITSAQADWASEPSHQQQDDEDHEDDAEKAAWAITPAAAVGPSRHGADQQQDDNDEQDGADTHEE